MRVGFLQNLRSKLDGLFSVRMVDEHLVIRLFTLKFCKKFDYKYDFQPASEYGLNREIRNPKVIVSLTTFPARIEIVYKTITTIMQQSVKPDKIVLWLAEEQFPDKNLPENLTRLEQFGLTIKWCEDIRSYKKLIPSLKEYPDDIIVTLDDDYYYDKDLLKTLLEEHEKYPNCIIANRAMRLIVKQEGKHRMVKRSYIYDSSYLPSYKNFFIGFGGVLYPPHCLYSEVLDKEKFMTIIPTNDDAWFWLNAIRNNTKIVQSRNGYKLKMYPIENSQELGLYKLNCNNSQLGITGEVAANMFAEQYPDFNSRIHE